MPEDFEMEVLMERLIFIEKVKQGLEQLDSGNTLIHEEVKQKINNTWQKSARLLTTRAGQRRRECRFSF